MNRYALLMFAVAAAGFVGCQNQKPAVSTNDLFQHDFAPRQLHVIMDSQASRGARHDATFYDAHFDRGQVNSLGKAKLDLMYGSDGKFPEVIYLDVSGRFEERRDSIIAYVAQTGIDPGVLAFEQGGNPRTANLASINAPLLFNRTATGLEGSTPKAATEQSGGTTSMGFSTGSK